MALPSPDTGQTFLQRVNVNDLDRYYCEVSWRWLHPGAVVVLRRQKDNPADKNAVEVRIDRQIGWVPRAQNQRIAQLLDDGENLKAVVVHAGPARLDLNVYVVHKGPDQPGPLSVIRITGAPSQDPQGDPPAV